MVTEDFGKQGEDFLKRYLDADEQTIAKVNGINGEGLVLTQNRVYLLKWGGLSAFGVGKGVSRFKYSEIETVELNSSLLILWLDFNVRGGESQTSKVSSVSAVNSIRQTVASFPKRKKDVVTELFNFIKQKQAS
jgi:hypothetical protein